VQFLFAGHTLDTDRRELRRGDDVIAVEPQVFDLLVYLVQNRDRVVSKDDLIAAVWRNRIVSDSTLTSRINAARKAVGDSGNEQKLIRTVPRKGLRFVGDVHPPASADQAVHKAAADDLHEPRTALPLPDRPAIAVLPFVNMSGEAEQEYFSDGISEDIITALSKLRWFFVIARNSSFVYKGKSVHMKQIAEELGVGYVVEGSVRKGGESPSSSTTSPPAVTSGPNATTAVLPTCSQCRTRSLRRSSPRSSRSSTPRKIFARGASRPTAWTPGTW
jgi:DNA-binding winged helix-turn-helix (wHTH) protein